FLQLDGWALRISLETMLQKNYGDLPLITCHPGQLNQVFMNLLVNAIDALEDYTGKRSYEELKAHPNIIQIHTSVSSNQQVTIAIQDNGPGILKILKSKLFNPFFTTKPIGKGTGLGLSICYDIITEKHGGKISCKSERGKGTTFLIELPIRKQLDSQPV
ncbi:MAG: ATP-binding protein, partial [Cyanobacteria bacterium J06639_14]